MKKIAGVIIATAVMVLCLAFSACGSNYVTNYSAVLMTTINSPTQATVSFDSFSGKYVMKLRNTGDGEVAISYNATLEEGSIKAYYDYNGEKLNLFEIGNDGVVEGKTEGFTSNKTIYVIIESDAKSIEGNFSFVLEKAQ